MTGTNLLKLVQQKLAEKEELIHEQQRQLTELESQLQVAVAEQAEKDEVIRELMVQVAEFEALQNRVADLESQLADAESDPATRAALMERDEVISAQMSQILELEEKLADMEARLQAAEEKVVQFDELQAQLKELLGE